MHQTHPTIIFAVGGPGVLWGGGGVMLFGKVTPQACKVQRAGCVVLSVRRRLGQRLLPLPLPGKEISIV